MRTVQAISAIFVLSLIIGCGSGQNDDVDTWYNYGESITKSDFINVSHAVENIDGFAEIPVVVEGTITQVCQSRGCWMVVEDGGKSIRIRFADYGFFVPWESAGKYVRVQGTLSMETISEETARHWAEEADDPDVNPGEIHGDQEVVMMMATAVSIKDGTPISEEQMSVIGDNDTHERTH